MKILVIGGTLFIGKRLVTELVKLGHDVTVLHRQPKHGFSRKVTNLAADRNDPAQIRPLISAGRFEAVFDNVYDWERGTTAAQVEAAATACGDRLARYIFMSSVAAYGDGLNHHEGHALAPDDHPDPYVRNKAMTERMLFRLHSRNRFPAVTLRPPFVYGPENPFYREAFFWDRMRLKRPIVLPGDGLRLMQFVYVDDLVKACLGALKEPAVAGESFNVGHDRPVTQAELVQALAAAAGKKPEVARVPRDVIQEAKGNPMGHPMYFAQYYDLPPITMVIAKAKRMLKFRAVPFEQALAETYRWHMRHHERPEQDFSFEDRLIASAGIVRSAAE